MEFVKVDTLEAMMTAVLHARGLSPEHVLDVVSGLLRTSLRGVDTHGVRLFPLYVRELDGGRAKGQPEFRWHEGGASAQVLDAGASLGIVAGMAAARRAVEIARTQGTGAVAVANSNHFGAASVYTLFMADQNMIGMCFSNSDALVAPSGGIKPLFGTNPISLAVKGLGDDVFCLDMATSQVAFSKVRAHRQNQQALEPGWAVAAGGEDAAHAGDRHWEFMAMKPLGGYKGQGLAMMVEILCALLTDMPFDHELANLYEPPFDMPRLTGHFMLALDIAAFQEPVRFRERLSRLLAVVRAAEGPEPVVNPGDLELQQERRRLQEGIPLEPGIWKAIQRLFAETGNP